MNIFSKLISLLKSETEMVPNQLDDMARVKYGSLYVSKELDNFLREELVPGINIQPSLFWKSLESILNTFGPKNIELLAKRESLQNQIDNWHIERKGQEHNAAEYKTFLKKIGYLLEEGDDSVSIPKNFGSFILMPVSSNVSLITPSLGDS